jgi:hypothetical protein
MPSCALVNFIDKDSTPDEVHFDFYLMTRTMYKLWLLEEEDDRQQLKQCVSEPVATP